MSSGNSKVADEINNLLRKEERDRKSSRVKSRMPQVQLIDQPEVLQRIAETLKLEQTLLHEGLLHKKLYRRINNSHICMHVCESV